jgi:spore germination cell wall hydrolase CwlJ-like protein
MLRMFRAAAFAAASFVLLFAVDASPSFAWELAPTQILQTESEFETPAAAAPAPEAEPSAPRVSRTLAELVAEHGGTRTESAQHECLAGAVYFEAKGESLQGQLTVAEVILNRTRSGRFPASVCGVVKQRGQFSFVRGGRIPPVARGTAAWRKAVGIARIALGGLADGAAPKALFFHARYVSPGWKLKRVAAVGNHIFYR